MKISLDKDAIMPTRAHQFDAGLDLYSREDKIIRARDSAIFDTGVHIDIPKNCAGLIVSKSGLNVNKDITSTGLIDSGYTGSIIIKLYNNGNEDYKVYKGDKISQLVLININYDSIEQVAELDDNTDRGENGFGSSGR